MRLLSWGSMIPVSVIMLTIADTTLDLSRRRKKLGIYCAMSIMQSDDDDVEDPQIYAKEAAIQKVVKLFPLPDSLASFKKIRDDYASRLQRNDALLTSSVMNQVEYTKAGMEAISQAKVTVSKLREISSLTSADSLGAEEAISLGRNWAGMLTNQLLESSSYKAR